MALLAIFAGIVLSCADTQKSAAVSSQDQPGGSSPLLSQPGANFAVPDSALPRDLSVIVYGDTRFTDPANHDAANPQSRRALVAKIAEEHPDALIVTGDVPYRGAVAADYAEFETETAAWRAEKLRVYPVLGNHELAGKGTGDPVKNWWAAFPELNNRRWYSVALGSRVYVLALDSNSALTAGSPQRMWVEEQIAHLPSSVEFVFIALHHPPVADIQTIFEVDHNPRPNEISLRDYLSTVAPHTHEHFIVAAGHIHNYERFETAGVTYLVSGGGGAHPYPVQRTPPDLYQGADFPIFHYIVFHMRGRKLDATTWKVGFPVSQPAAWQAIDHFVISAP